MDTSIELQNAVESFSNGKKESFNQIYELSYRYLHTCVIHVVKDEDAAMDVLQDTYLEVSKSIVQLKNKEGFLNWTATIANRKCYAYLRNQKDTLLYIDKEDEETDDFFENIADNEEYIPETVLQNREKQRLIREIIYGLTDIQRLCVIGFYYNEQKQDEIADELGIPVNTVKSHLNRAKAKIKDAVVELDEKKGTRLYSMAPFMLLFFKEEVKACVLKPMTSALALEVGASTTKVSTSGVTKDAVAKVKSLWSKSATAVKAKIAVGATVGTVAIGGAVVGLSQPEGEKISLEFQSLLDQTIQICEAGDYEQLSDLDDEWEALFEQWEDNDSENIRFNEMGEGSYKFYDKDQEIINNCFYDGEDGFLKKDYTGYGVGIHNNELALGYFKDGKPEGELTTIMIDGIFTGYQQADGSFLEDEYILYDVTKLQIEGGSIINNVEMTSYYDYQKFEHYEGSVSLVEYIDWPRRWDGYAFTDRVSWTMYDYNNSNSQDGLPIEAECIFYMNEQGMIDRNRNVIENNMISTEIGRTIYLEGEYPQGSLFRNIYVSMVYFDIGDELEWGYNMMVESENKETTEIIVETEDEATTESIEYIIITDDTPGINGATVAAVAKEYEQKYIKYEDMAPTTMYAIRYSEMYPDLNASEGVLRMDGCVFVGDEVIIDGKGTYDGVEYYRIKRPEICFNPYSSILPADALSPEKPHIEEEDEVTSEEADKNRGSE